MVDPELSQAVVIYYSVGTGSWPRADPDGVRAAFGARADELLDSVQVLATEMHRLPLDWEHESLVEATARVEAHFRSTHPELSEEAIHALGWSFSYSWR